MLFLRRDYLAHKGLVTIGQELTRRETRNAVCNGCVDAIEEIFGVTSMVLLCSHRDIDEEGLSSVLGLSSRIMPATVAQN